MRVMVIDGNTRADRCTIAAGAGATPGEAYADVLRTIVPTVQVDICTPADADAQVPMSLEAYDGVVITGSILHIHKREQASLRQIDLVREIFQRGIPMFGSCWGLQLAAVAAGGDVAPNPRGREVAFARKIMLSDGGRDHPMHLGRPPAFDAPAMHRDEVVRVPDGTLVTAWNTTSMIQAAVIHSAEGEFWGVQYHPEYRLREVAAALRRHCGGLVDEGFFPDLAALERYAGELDVLDGDPSLNHIAWRLDLGRDIIQDHRRICEIANWVSHRVQAGDGARRRG
jgi:GMP synthase (glutamine-hydrolysing)